MAGEDLLASVLLGGVNGAAMQPSPWTIAAQGLASTIPLLIDPNASRSSNLIAGLGGGLLSGLMGGYGQYSQQLEQQRQQQVAMQLIDPTTPAETKLALTSAPENAAIASRFKLAEVLTRQQQAAAQEAAKNELFQAVAKERASEGFEVPGFDAYMQKMTGSPTQTAIAATVAPTIAQPTPATVAAEVPTVQPTTAAAAVPLTPKDQKNLEIEKAKVAIQKAADQPNKDREMIMKVTQPTEEVGRELSALTSQFDTAARKLAENKDQASVNQLLILANKVANPGSVVSQNEINASKEFRSLWKNLEGKVRLAAAGKAELSESEVNQLLGSIKPFVLAKGEQYNMLKDQAIKTGTAFKLWDPADPKVDDYFVMPKFMGVKTDLIDEVKQIAAAIQAGQVPPDKLPAIQARAAEIRKVLGRR